MRSFAVCVFLLELHTIMSQQGAQYLQNVIQDLRYMKGMPSKRVDTQLVLADEPPTQITERKFDSKNVPPLSLTKGELAALYEAAVAKGDTVKLDAGDDSYIHAAVHELDGNHKKTGGDDVSGYYYYYYPVKSFLDDMNGQSTSHNVKITKEIAPEKKKGLEPLFMAISGFIGMAVMFVLSVLVFPKFGIKKPALFKANAKKHERITDIARVALQAIEGKDCQERFACELEKTARAFNVQDNRFVKLLKRMAPAAFGKQMNKMGKYSNKRLRCTAIPCKKKNPAGKKKPPTGVQKKT